MKKLLAGWFGGNRGVWIPRSSPTLFKGVSGGEEDFEFGAIGRGDGSIGRSATSCCGLLLVSTCCSVHFRHESFIEIAERRGLLSI